MADMYLLDTNAYYLFFQAPKLQPLINLETRLKNGAEISFYISEITSLEVHSVLGKYSRGVSSHKNLCDRSVVDAGNIVPCLKQWVVPGRKKMKPKVFHGIRKMILDIENGRGEIKAQVLGLNSDIVLEARNFLYKYADTYNFGSHDAIIAATTVVNRRNGGDFILVTSDKGLKAALNVEGVPYYDPREQVS